MSSTSLPFQHPRRRIKAVMFDLDDTLIDWSSQKIPWEEFNRPRMAAAHDYLRQTGHTIPLTADELGQRLYELSLATWQASKHTWRGGSLRDVWRDLLGQLGVDPTQVDVDALLQSYGWEPFPGVDLFPDTLPVLQTLRDEGYALGLITNAYHPMWMRDIELRHYGLIEYFPARITSGDTGYQKPHPAIFWRMMGWLQVEPSEAVFVGDSPENDIAGANEVGMVSVLMAPPHLDRPLDGVKPTYTVKKLSELLPILHQLNGA